MGFEHTRDGQLALFACGLFAGLLVGRVRGHGWAAVAVAAVPFVGFGCTQWFC